MTGVGMRRLFGGCLLAAALLGGGGLAAAQAESDVRETIAGALALLGEADSYAYTVTLDTTNQLTDESGETFGARQLYEISGAANGADYQDTVELTMVPLEAEDEAQTTTLERVQVDETFYARLDALLAEQLGVDGGWWAQAELLTSLGEDSVRRYSAEQLALLPTPATLSIDENLIRSIEEAEPEKIDGLAMRVFDVEMKAVEAAMALHQVATGDRLASFFENAALLLHSEFSFTYRLYVGAEDGRLYRVESAAYTYLPFLAFGGDSDPDYDITTDDRLTYAISEYDMPVEIEAPTTGL